MDKGGAFVNRLKSLGILLCIAVPLPAFAQKAKTIDELAAMLDSAHCAECHDVIYAQWEQSQHARPLMGIRGTLNMTLLATAGASPFLPADPKQATLKTYPCFKCHLPQAVDCAEDSVAVELTEAIIAQDKAKIAKLQITCIVCHNEKAIIHMGYVSAILNRSVPTIGGGNDHAGLDRPAQLLKLSDPRDPYKQGHLGVVKAGA